MACWMNPQLDDETFTTVKNLRPEKLDDFIYLQRDILDSLEIPERKKKTCQLKTIFSYANHISMKYMKRF